MITGVIPGCGTRQLIPSVANIDPYDDPNSFADKARLEGRYGSSFERCNAARRANLGHHMGQYWRRLVLHTQYEDMHQYCAIPSTHIESARYIQIIIKAGDLLTFAVDIKGIPDTFRV